MSHIVHWNQTYLRTPHRVIETIGAVMRALTREHTLALQAATKAAAPRQKLAEVRAMYVRTCESTPE